MKLKVTRSLVLALALLGSSAAQQGAATGEPIVFATAPLPKGFLRQPYHFKLEAQGGITPLRWEVTNGSPPEGYRTGPGRHSQRYAHRSRQLSFRGDRDR